MKKFERQNILRRCGVDYRTYANLLELQRNRCAVCLAEPPPRRRLVAAGRCEFPLTGKLVCPKCKHIVDAQRRDPRTIRRLADVAKTQSEQEDTSGPLYVETLYADQAENRGKNSKNPASHAEPQRNSMVIREIPQVGK